MTNTSTNHNRKQWRSIKCLNGVTTYKKKLNLEEEGWNLQGCVIFNICAEEYRLHITDLENVKFICAFATWSTVGIIYESTVSLWIS